MHHRQMIRFFDAIPVLIFIVFFASLSHYVKSARGPYSSLWNKSLWNETWVDKLKKDLLLKYDKYARPAQHYNTTVVSLNIEVHHVSLDDMKSVLSVHAWLQMVWTDEKLKWNSSNYGGLQETYLGTHEIWQPDIYLYNSATGSMVEHYGDTHCLVYEDGTVLWVPPSHFLAFCNLDLRLWPFDTHTCTLKLGSWMYPGDQVDLRLREKTSETHDDLLIQNSEWELVEITRGRHLQHYVCCGEPYVYLVFNLTLKRNALLYYNLVFTPTVPIVFLTLITFWLPPQSEMKVTLAGCTALIITIVLVYFGYKIPPSGNSVPLVVSFYSGCLYQITISLILSILVINLAKKPCCVSVPRGIKRLLLAYPVKYLGLSDLILTIKLQKPNCGQELHESHIGDGVTSNNYDDSDRLNMLSPVKNIAQLEWILLATTIDRISFIIFCAIFSIMAIAYIT